MKIIRQYILKESIIPFFLALFTLTCVFLLGSLIQLTNLVVNKGVPLTVVGKIFVFSVPVLLGYTIPIACLVSVIMTFSRLSNDNEILTIRVSGIHVGKILLPIVIIGTIISLICVLLNERIIPYAHYEQQKLLKTLGSSNPTALLEAGLFIHSFENQIIFIHKIEGNKMYNVTIYQPQPNGPTRTIIAKKGEFTSVPGKEQLKLKLIDGTADEPNLENPNNFYKLNFKNYFMTLDLSKNRQNIKKKPKGMTFRELKDEVANLKGNSPEGTKLFDIARLEAEYQRKITWSFAALIFMILGFPMAVITHKRERSANVVMAVLCAVVYYLLSLGCEALAIKNIVRPEIIMWVPNMIGFVIATILNIKCVS